MNASSWERWGLALLTAAAYWIGAFALVTLAQLWAPLYASLGGDLPTPAQLVMDAARHHIPFGIALAVTALAGVLARSRSPRLPQVCALMAALGFIALALAAVSLVLPISKCGVLWPAWPGTDCQS